MSGLREPLTSSAEENRKLLGRFSSRRLKNAIKKQFSFRPAVPSDKRRVFCNDPERNEEFEFVGNSTSTTKFTLITFVPKALFEQFRRAGYWYFTLMAVFSLTPVSPYTAVTVIVPLVFVLALALAREAWEDCGRARLDSEVNSRKVKVHDGQGQMVVKKWRDVQVGDIIRIEEGEHFPSDLILLSSSGPNGICYVETRNLDGETNLKARQALEETWGINEPSVLENFRCEIICEVPNASLYTFVGTLNLPHRSVPLGPQQLLLRDSSLQNTDYAYGVVVYSGHDTKSMQNSTPPPSKRSGLDKRLDTIIWGLFMFLLAQSILTGIILGVFTATTVPGMYYLQPFRDNPYYTPNHPIWVGVLSFVTSVILYSYLIPIALYVSLEMSRAIQAYFIGQDLKLYDPISDNRAQVKTAGLNEELGQVDTILSDKTGTLTCNQMDFLRCSIAGVSYGSATTEVEKAAKKLGINISSRPSSIISFQDAFLPQSSSLASESIKEPFSGSHSETEYHGDMHKKIQGYNFSDFRLEGGSWVYEKDPECIRKFFEILALCHTVIPDGDMDKGEIRYRAESPDESAFVIAAKELGFVFYKRTPSCLYVRELFSIIPSPTYQSSFSNEESNSCESNVESSEIKAGPEGSGKDSIPSSDHVFELKAVMEFTSARKRMSVIVRYPNGKLYLLSKGADSVMFTKLKPVSGQKYAQKTIRHLTRYGEAGLRTLVLAYRELQEEEFLEWDSLYTEARSMIGSERENRIQEIEDMIEKDLILVGGTGVEDKLQEGVPECIHRLALAGIKMWVLTGDKVETAINIGYACSLLRAGMELIEITPDVPQIHVVEPSGNDEPNEDPYQALRENVLEQIEKGLKFIEDLRIAATSSDEIKHCALIIDGHALSVVLAGGTLLTKFIELASSCASVLCCRVSPRQKALVTKVVKNKMGAKRLCLAIGDGANDVGMIQAADVGVGINGVEGAQAAMAADFSIGQFRFLERLLLVHGHWCYRRIALMIMYSAYKVTFHGLTLFYSSILSNFSGQPLVDDWYSSFYNTVFTALPICIVGVLDQDVSPENAAKYPLLYKQGQKNMFFKWREIWLWVLNGVYSSVVVFFFPVFAFCVTSLRGDGMMMSLEELGTMVFTSLVLAANIQLALAINYFTWIHHFSFISSILLWFIFLLVYGSLPISWAPEGYGIFMEVLAPSPSYWILQLLAVVVILLPYFAYSSFRWRFQPLDYQIVLEEEALEKWKKRCHGSCFADLE